MNNWYFIHVSNPRKPKLLLLHGLTSDAHILKPLAKCLKDNFDIYIPAFPGIGETPTDNIKTVSDLVLGIYQFGKQHNLFPCVVFGTSLGGTSALLLSEMYPNIFSNIIVHDPPWRRSSIHFGLFQEFELIISKVISVYPKLIKNKARVQFLLKIAAILKPDLSTLIKKYESKIIRVLVDTDIKTTLNLLFDLRNSDFTNRLNRIEQSVNIICAESDEIVLPTETHKLAKTIQNSKMISIQDADHDMVLDMPDIIAGVILSVYLQLNKI
jgi:pimeloyl-ACP methyl ester carboxylesterase